MKTPRLGFDDPDTPPAMRTCPTEEPLDDFTGENDEGIGLPSRGKPSVKNPLGRVAFDTKGFSSFKAKPWEDKRNVLRQQWIELAYLLLGKATTLSATVSKKDFGRLMQLVTTAGIAHDKVFPKVESPSVGNLVVNLFKGLPSEKVLGVIGTTPSPKGEYVQGIS